MKRKLYAVWDHAIYGAQWFTLYFFRGFSTATVASSLWLGMVFFTAAWLSKIFGEDRAISLIQKHPGIFLLLSVLFMVGTCGLGYWAWTRNASDFKANFKGRMMSHSRLFKVA
jgi:hypothetical protein